MVSNNEQGTYVESVIEQGVNDIYCYWNDQMKEDRICGMYGTCGLVHKCIHVQGFGG